MNPDLRLQWLIRFGYAGHRFFGLQPQPGLTTAGGALRQRLEQAAGQRARGLNFTARTDRGVSAIANLATCWFVAPLADTFIHALCTERDDGLHNVSAFRVDKSVHARNVGVAKWYRYTLSTHTAEAAAWHIVPSLDISAMQNAAEMLVGTHDFSAFRGGGCSAATAEKSLYCIEIQATASHVTIDLWGNAFLRKMVRNIVGTLAEIGCGLRTPASMLEILQSRDRLQAGVTAPALGLTLMEVITTGAVFKVAPHLHP